MPVGLLGNFLVGGSVGSFTQLLLHFNGSNGSTTFVDSSTFGRTPTVNGNTQISTAQSVFGGASGLFDGTGDSLQYTAGSQWSFGTGDWTIEFRFRPTSTSGFGVMVGLGNGANTGTFLVARSSTNLVFYHESGTERIIGSGVFSVDTWYAVAISCVSGSVKAFVDGVQVGSTYTASTAVGTAADDLYIGSRVSGNGIAGYIDELRITKGVGYYSANYTPDASPFPDT